MKQMLFLMTMLLAGTASYAQNNYGDIIGTLVDKSSKPIWAATVVTSQGDAVYHAMTDFDGRYRISAVPAGTYKVMFLYEGDTVVAPELVEVTPNGYGDLGLVSFIKEADLAKTDTKELDEAVIYAKIKLEKGEAPVSKLSQKEIKYSPSKNDIKGLITGMTSEVRQTEDGSLVFRGARKGDMIYYVDGVKMNQVQNLPSSALGYVMVYSGAIPAKYGDTNGGVVVVETRSYFDLLREYNNRISLGE